MILMHDSAFGSSSFWLKMVMRKIWRIGLTFWTGDRFFRWAIVLTCMQRMSGCYDHTSSWIRRSFIPKARLRTPGRTHSQFRWWEKWAVHIGGGLQSSFCGSIIMVMLKDNHCDFAGGIRCRKSSEPDLISTQMNSMLRLKLKLRKFGGSSKKLLESGWSRLHYAR